MILQEIFESKMSELDIEYQDYKNLEPVAFYSRYKMTPDQWASKHWSLIKSSETVHEGSQTFGKHDPYWVCVNGKKWKRFDTYEHARAVHDRLEKKLRSEGSNKKVSLLADDDVKEGLRNPKDNPCWKGYKPVGTKQKGGRTVPNCVPKE